MRHFLFALCIAVAGCSTTPTQSATGYDAALAQRLGADERGMKMYVLVILKTGPNTTATPSERQRLFEGHMANIGRLASAGKLLVAGPFETNARQYRGLFLFDVATVAEAEALTRTDPALAAGIFAMEAYPWYGSAALMEMPAIHKRLERKAE